MIRTKDHYDDDLYPFFFFTYTSCLGNKIWKALGMLGSWHSWRHGLPTNADSKSIDVEIGSKWKWRKNHGKMNDRKTAWNGKRTKYIESLSTFEIGWLQIQCEYSKYSKWFLRFDHTWWIFAEQLIGMFCYLFIQLL